MKENATNAKDILYYERLVHFQGEMMEHLYDEYQVIFGLIAEFMQCSHIMYVNCDEKGIVQMYLYDSTHKSITAKEGSLNMEVGSILQMNKKYCQTEDEVPEIVKDFLKKWQVSKVCEMASIAGRVDQTMYSVLFCRNGMTESAEGFRNLWINNIKMCMENRIYHEIVTYESNHDQLTRLYNRRCYFQRSQEEYPLLDSIGILYFDVNNLKTVNDCYGHDAGDALLQKAAESIRSITSDKVHGYRMGGDEFIVIITNCTQNDVDAILRQWEKELSNVNEKYGGDPCVIAVGTAYATGCFEIEDLCQLADKRMYKDKEQKKNKGMV